MQEEVEIPIRPMLLAVCGLVGALAAFAGAPATAQTPQRGGTLVFAVNSEPRSCDCINTTTFVAMQTLSPFYSTLLKYDRDKFPEIRGLTPAERMRRALTFAIDRWTGSAALSRTVFVKAVGASLRPGDPLAMSDAAIVKYPGFGRDGAAAKAEARRLLQEAGQSNLRFKLVTRNVPMPFQPMAVWLAN
jgi:ABC-type transport system substrate-binding protein